MPIDRVLGSQGGKERDHRSLRQFLRSVRSMATRSRHAGAGEFPPAEDLLANAVVESFGRADIRA